MTQPSLDLTPTEPRPDTPVEKEIKRLNAAAVRVLCYLQDRQGLWVSNGTLAQVGGLRFGGRIFELRKHGWVIEDQAPKEGGTWRYRLVGRKQS
jgi:hypothetical protein